MGTDVEIADLDLAELQNDGDILNLDDGTMLRLRFESDDMPVGNLRDHGDCWGDTSEYSYDYHHDGNAPRPDGFDGNAEKIQIGRGDWIWWQPPADVPRTDPHFAALRSNVRDIRECGFQGIIVERLDGTDAYGRAIVRRVASLWGIEPYIDAEYRANIVTDLVTEVLDD